MKVFGAVVLAIAVSRCRYSIEKPASIKEFRWSAPMNAGIVRLELVALLVLGAAGCSGSTDPQGDQVTRQRALWAAHSLTKYSYDYEQTGFFNNLAGHVIRLVVLGDTVRSAVFVATGESVPGPAMRFPIVDSLFAEASRAAENHSLTAIEFDPQLGYPVRMDLAGPPDASGSIFASHLQPLP